MYVKIYVIYILIFISGF